MQIETDLTQDLYEWGKWAAACPSRSLNYPREQPFNRMRRQQFTIEGGAGVNISDDWALELDRAISKLFLGDDEVLTLIELHFICGFSYRDIEKLKGFKRTRSQRIIENSISWLNGYIIGKRDAA